MARGSEPFNDPALVAAYEDWYQGAGRAADRAEKSLLASLLDRLPAGASLLEVGCGTGHFSRWLESRGHRVLGLDPSLPMLRAARGIALLQLVGGRGEELPLAARSIDVVAFITSLEFIGEPRAALAEAWRVARYGILVGALNRHSLLGRALLRRSDGPWPAATLYTVGELRRMVGTAGGGRRPLIRCRTTVWPGWRGSLRLPWGGFIGLSALRR
jgi:ubiquinone/menaquinone biosynthesis C-methylase UbiE